MHFDVSGHRLRISLHFVPVKRAVDVSRQPAIFEPVLPVGRGPCPPGSAGSTVAHWIADLAGTATAWRPEDPAASGLTGTAGGVAFPLLGSAYDRGATALGVVPTWAAPILSAPTPRTAADVAVGDKATRTVVAALSASLIEAEGGDGAPATLFRLAMALMGVPVLEPDRIARILGMAGPRRSEEMLPTATDIATGRSLVRRLAPAQAERLLLDVVEQPDGPEMLFEILRDGSGVFDQLPDRPPHRIRALRDQCRSLLPIDPCPAAGRWGRVRRPAAQVAPAEDAGPDGARLDVGADVDRAAVRPARAPARPVARRPRNEVRRTAPLAAHTSLLRDLASLHDREVGQGLRIVVPRSAAELVTWGRHLGNCVGDYGTAFARGRTHLLGVELDGVLTYCMEITTRGVVRQFLGTRNRPVPPEHARLVTGWLVRERVIIGRWS